MADENEMFADLTEFLLQERRNDTKQYHFIKDIYAGIVLSSIIITNDEVMTSFEEKLNIKNVLLDSNYIFRLLDLQTKLEGIAAQDTYNALKENDCQFWVCEETIKQISDTIHSFISSCSETVNTILRSYGDDRFTGLASACIRRSLTASSLEKIVSEIEDTLKDKYNVNYINRNDYNSDLIDIKGSDFEELQKIKVNSSTFGIIHDLLLIHIVSDKRPRMLYKAERAGWWVLTDDNKLTTWNTKNSLPYNIPDCITESQLATVMWLCNPKAASLDGLFNTIIALKSQGLAGNDEYIKITKEIERQKERFSEDEGKLKKLAFLFSRKLLDISDFLDPDNEKKDAIFDNMIDDSEKQREEDKAKIEEQKKLLEEKGKETTKLSGEASRLSDEVDKTKSLLSAQTERLIDSLKKRQEDKENELERITTQLTDIENYFGKRSNIAKWFVKILLMLVLFVLVCNILPLISSYEEWFSNNQLLINVFSKVISAIIIICGFNVKIIQNFICVVSRKIVDCLFKNNLLKYTDSDVENLYYSKSEIVEKIKNIQDEIEKELGE